MIKEIEKPNIEFKFTIYNDYKYYYDQENNEYFIKYKNKVKFYFNLEGRCHRIGKPAIEGYDGIKIWVENNIQHRLDGPACGGKNNSFWIGGIEYSAANFALKTDHLICLVCNKFCNQGCFL